MAQHFEMQQEILSELVSMGIITTERAQAVSICVDQAAIIPELWRITRDDEAIAAAVSKTQSYPLFNQEVVMPDKLHLGPESQSCFVYDGTLYLDNPLNQADQNAAINWFRGQDVQTVGVVSLTRLDKVKNNKTGISNSLAAVDDQQAANTVTETIKSAALHNASDIHFEPSKGNVIDVRYRIDGELVHQFSYPNVLHEPICRVIIEGRCRQQLKTSLPQDGKFEYDISGNKKIGLRTSTLSVVVGAIERLKIVMRLLGNERQLTDLSRLGLSAENLEAIIRLAMLPNGMVIVTGPTGSGKTTLLNAILLYIYGKSPTRNYHTLEEPVEFQHEGINSTECGEHLTFAMGLRALLRQDPDVLLVGEMRDTETAELAYKGSMTGHMILTTLHTNNSHEAVGRLDMMDISPDIVASNTTAFLAIRLCRRLCGNCKIEYKFGDDERRFKMYGSNRRFNGNSAQVLYRANKEGCPACTKGKGHKSGGLSGRQAVLEILEVTQEIQQQIIDREGPAQMRRGHIADGSFSDLWDDGLRHVADGILGFEQLEQLLKPYLFDRPISLPVRSATVTPITSHAMPNL